MLRVVRVPLLVQVRCLVLQQAPQKLDKDVVEGAAATAHGTEQAASAHPVAERRACELHTWSVLKIPGVPKCSAAASLSMQNTLSMVFDSRHNSTWRLVQPMTATR